MKLKKPSTLPFVSHAVSVTDLLFVCCLPPKARKLLDKTKQQEITGKKIFSSSMPRPEQMGGGPRDKHNRENSRKLRQYVTASVKVPRK